MQLGVADDDARLILAERPRDDDIVRFVFGTEASAPGELPQRTTLERAIAAHLRAGRHWHERCGSAIIG